QGFKLGFGGAMTFPGSRRIRRLARELPLEAIVLETDAPDIPPAWGYGVRNEPENMRRYAEILAGLRGITLDEAVEATCANALNIFGLKRMTSAFSAKGADDGGETTGRDGGTLFYR
ncbi:MAG: TatD family hydrolase, partial [Azoarcus sp.]|nr:TatD family hydrolase [Azoarcus sp.]